MAIGGCETEINSMSLTASKTSLHPDDTIVAVSSAAGPARRAIVRLSGPDALAALRAVFLADDPRSLANPPRHRLIPGNLRLTGVHSPLPALLYFFRAPRTYTGQDLAEIHTIGSPPLVERLVSDLLSAGARPAQPGEFTLRAFLAGKKDLPQAEAVHAVIEADSDADLRVALAQLAGGVSQPLHELRSELLNLLADLEAALDFADEDIEFVSRADTLGRLDAALEQLTALRRQFEERAISGRPVRIAFVGLPNVGKSSLFNKLAAGDAIVSDVPGTTRDYLMRRSTLGGVGVEYIDTAGWEGAQDTIVDQAQRLGREQASRADAIVWCVEAGGKFSAEDESRLRSTGVKVIRVWTKCDLLPQQDVPAIPASVRLTGGTDELLAALVREVTSLARSSLAPSQSRCRHHLDACIIELSQARELASASNSPEFTAAALRTAIDQLGEMTGAVYTNDLLDRIFSRFCIGK